MASFWLALAAVVVTVGVGAVAEDRLSGPDLLQAKVPVVALLLSRPETVYDAGVSPPNHHISVGPMTTSDGTGAGADGPDGGGTAGAVDGGGAAGAGAGCATEMPIGAELAPSSVSVPF